jgi:hypothetical protein
MINCKPKCEPTSQAKADGVLQGMAPHFQGIPKPDQNHQWVKGDQQGEYY